MAIVCICVLVIASLTNVTCCAIGNRKYRIISKMFIVPSILCLYILWAQTIQWSVIVALLLGWIGDILLVVSKRGIVKIIGGASFEAGHILYIVSFHYGFGELTAKWLYVVIPIVAIVAMGLGASLIKKYIPSKLKILGIGYYTILAIELMASLFMFAYKPDIYFWSVIGAVLFSVSDIVICKQFCCVSGRKQYEDVIIMSTYICAQVFLMLGFIQI